ncbi:hypothetical protein PR202_gb29216 [Eleusine coracana subsp. coracana]|uniref:DET1- and DDB1-associated protein 1 domain-containing protein n=1 Tax=Eleusine coracana subsp. coracana TaxID=191504 RepID=A0AAV5FZR9_ELECO|nr:hypothetical protein PR202_gb29216 [Eleusine coracana subsp. coracana]
MSSRVVVELGLRGFAAPCDGVLGIGVDALEQVHSPAADGESPVLGGAPLDNAESLLDESTPNRRVLALSKDSSVGWSPDIEPMGADGGGWKGSTPAKAAESGAATALAGLPSRGNFTESNIASSTGGLKIYLCLHDTAPPDGQVVKTDTNNILIRALQLSKQKSEAKDVSCKTPGESSRGKRNAARSLDAKNPSKRPNTGNSAGFSTHASCAMVNGGRRQQSSTHSDRTKKMWIESGIRVSFLSLPLPLPPTPCRRCRHSRRASLSLLRLRACRRRRRRHRSPGRRCRSSCRGSGSCRRCAGTGPRWPRRRHAHRAAPPPPPPPPPPPLLSVVIRSAAVQELAATVTRTALELADLVPAAVVQITAGATRRLTAAAKGKAVDSGPEFVAAGGMSPVPYTGLGMPPSLLPVGASSLTAAAASTDLVLAAQTQAIAAMERIHAATLAWERELAAANALYHRASEVWDDLVLDEITRGARGHPTGLHCPTCHLPPRRYSTCARRGGGGGGGAAAVVATAVWGFVVGAPAGGHELPSDFSELTLQSFTVEKLRSLLKEKGLSPKGKKASANIV